MNYLNNQYGVPEYLNPSYGEPITIAITAASAAGGLILKGLNQKKTREQEQRQFKAEQRRLSQEAEEDRALKLQMEREKQAKRFQHSQVGLKDNDRASSVLEYIKKHKYVIGGSSVAILLIALTIQYKRSLL